MQVPVHRRGLLWILISCLINLFTFCLAYSLGLETINVRCLVMQLKHLVFPASRAPSC